MCVCICSYYLLLLVVVVVVVVFIYRLLFVRQDVPILYIIQQKQMSNDILWY